MRTISENRQSKINIDKSTFFGFTFYIYSEQDIKDILTSIQAEHPQAFMVYAYCLVENKALQEERPNPPSPRPDSQALYDLIKKKDLCNCLLIVVGYFDKVNFLANELDKIYVDIISENLENNIIEFESDQ
ncbi:MAG: YigZ family protein [Candidatus Komeilibacteria bacterium]|jgi:putative IMPACT (imprinted ancient) family translation regulator|nr:YigZ family protein [Candidatus Komeilibacteria bacterium]MBT4447916.1 YigZ family protein [Candidatus Komeilibacteria bacterium]